MTPEEIAKVVAYLGTGNFGDRKWTGFIPNPFDPQPPPTTPPPTTPPPVTPPPTTLPGTPPPTQGPPAGTTQSSWPQGAYTGNTSSPTDFYGTLPQGFRTFNGFPQGTTSQGLLPGYGTSQQINNMGIPGLERNQMIGGGSWAGTVFNPPNGPNTFKQNPLIFPETEYYDQYGNPKPITANSVNGNSFAIRPASPWYTTQYLQTYGGVAPPYDNIHQQLGTAMAGVPSAYPGFQWASPQMLGALRGAGLPGGWTAMLGFAPGGSK